MSKIFRSLELSKVILNGKTITGWSDDEDALTLPDASEYKTFKKGADGKMIVGSTGEKGGEVSIKLLANSPLVKFFSNVVLAEKNGASVEWNGIINYSDGSVVALEKGALMKAPNGVTMGKGTPKTMTYVFEFEVIDYETITGSF